LKVSFELSAKDMRYFRERLKEARGSVKAENEAEILDAAEGVVEEAVESEPPEFVLDRLKRLEQLVGMLRDEEWRLEGRDRIRILDALAYFVDPDDLIPDRIPGLGYLDDAIMVELVVQELKHEIKAYEDFCAFRKEQPKKSEPDKLETRRVSLQGRMRRRRRRERETLRSRRGSGPVSSLRLW
jgi:uncharacterized membrane protein YkvA (DUF1232 family)